MPGMSTSFAVCHTQWHMLCEAKKTWKGNGQGKWFHIWSTGCVI